MTFVTETSTSISLWPVEKSIEKIVDEVLAVGDVTHNHGQPQQAAGFIGQVRDGHFHRRLPAGLVAHRAPPGSAHAQKVGTFRYETIQPGGGIVPARKCSAILFQVAA